MDEPKSATAEVSGSVLGNDVSEITLLLNIILSPVSISQRIIIKYFVFNLFFRILYYYLLE